MVNSTILYHNHPYSHQSENVTINFGDQKLEIRFEMVTQYNNEDHQLKPVANWAHTLNYVHSYPGFKPSREVFRYHDGKKILRITSSKMIIEIRAAADLFGADALEFGSANVGIHSYWLSLVMLMYLVKEPVYTNMLVGCWQSVTFLVYIKKQVKKFTKGVNTQMLQHKSSSTYPHSSTP